MKKRYIIALLIIILNVVAFTSKWRIDCSSNNAHSLSSISKKTLEQMTDPISITIYVSDNISADMRYLLDGIRIVCRDYRSYAKLPMNFKIEKIKTKEQIAEAINIGIVPLFVETKRNNIEHVQSMFLGARVVIGDEEIIVPSIDKYFPIEYEFTRMFMFHKKKEKPQIAFVVGHNEQSKNNMSYFYKSLQKLYNIKEVQLDTVMHPLNCKVLCIIEPYTRYSYYERDVLNSYLSKGGKIFIAINYVVERYDFPDKNNGYINETGLEEFLEEKGLKIESNFVCDNNCGEILLDKRTNFLNIPSKIKSPFCPLITNFKKHPITEDIKMLQLSFCSSITQVKTTSMYMFSPLAMSSAVSGVKKAPLFFDLKKAWHSSEFDAPFSIVSAALTNEDNHSAIVVISDSHFLTKEEYTFHIDNVSFALNSIEWLSNNMELTALRNKYMEFRPLKTTSDMDRLIIRILNIVIPLLFLSLLVVIYHYHQSKRNRKRRNEAYID